MAIEEHVFCDLCGTGLTYCSKGKIEVSKYHTLRMAFKDTEFLIEKIICDRCIKELSAYCNNIPKNSKADEEKNFVPRLIFKYAKKYKEIVTMAKRGEYIELDC